MQKRRKIEYDNVAEEQRKISVVFMKHHRFSTVRVPLSTQYNTAKIDQYCSIDHSIPAQYE